MSEYIAVFIFGAVAGSFLNVCIHRMPRGESVVTPPSHCPNCQKNIPWYDNIPLVSYLILRARCRFCGSRIAFRYFAVELLAASASVFFYRRFGLSPDLLFYSVFVSCLIVATFVDIQHRIIPDEVSLGGLAFALLFSLVRPWLAARPWSSLALRESLLGALVGGGIIYLVGFLFDAVYFRMLKRPAVEGETTSMGGGDVKLLAMIGAFLGWQNAVLVFFLAPFFGLAIGTVNLVARKKHVLPYGPFLSLAAMVAAFWSDRVLALLFMR